MASHKLHLLAALGSLLILTAFIDSTQSVSCCVRYSKRVLPCKRIKGYTLQTINASCDISAVIFHVPGGFVCADPSKDWTLKRMKCLAERKKKALT